MKPPFLAALAFLLLGTPAAAQQATPKVELRPPPAWMTDPQPRGRPQIELRRAPDWLITPEGRQQGQPQRQPPSQGTSRPSAARPPAEPGEAEPARRQPQRIGIGRVDPREPVNLAEAPWRGVGRLQRENTICTAALVGPSSVITAAHCLVGRGEDGNRIMPAADFRFLLGYDRGRRVAEARVTAIRVDPDYDATSRTPGPQWADWALLTIDSPLGTPDRVLPLLRRMPLSSDRTMVGGYQQDRREVLMADPDCRVVGQRMQGLGRPMLLHDCTATRGASGSPILVELPEEGGWAVAGVLVSMARGMALGFAVPAEVLPEIR